jgi:hypothetical protein
VTAAGTDTRVATTSIQQRHYREIVPLFFARLPDHR